MPKQQITVEVESSAYNLGKDLGLGIADAVQKKSVGQIVADESASLMEIVQDAGLVKADLADNKEEFIKGVLLGVEAGLQPLFAPPAAVAAPVAGA